MSLLIINHHHNFPDCKGKNIILSLEEQKFDILGNVIFTFLFWNKKTEGYSKLF